VAAQDLTFQVIMFAFQGENQFMFQGTPQYVPPPYDGEGGDMWWGDFDTQIFPYVPPPPEGFIPAPQPAPSQGEPVLMALANGFLGYVGMATSRPPSSFDNPEGDDWWGSFDTQMFPYVPPPPLGYVPPVPVPQGGNPPVWQLQVLQNGFIGYIRVG
jgi:hypothetical protein